MKICKICSSDFRIKSLENKHFCNKHYIQIKRYGKPFNRTRFDKNEIFDCGEFLEMALYDKTNKINSYVKFDKKYLLKIKKFKWKNSHNYAYCTSQNISMHRLIMGNPKRMQVDHINHDTLDNRRKNLRICTHKENHQNILKNNKTKGSKFKGII